MFDHVVKVLKTRYTHATMVAMPGELTRIEVRGVSDGWRAGELISLSFFDHSAFFTILDAGLADEGRF